MKKLLSALGLTLAFSAGVASAQSTFQAVLSGLNEVGPNASPGTGFATLVLNGAQNQFTIDVSWSGLTAAATAGHIHGPGGAGTNASVLFPFSGVPAATSGAIPTQTFSINATQLQYLQSGYLYVNIHTSTFPGGEVRGQLTLVPEPTSAALIAVGCLAFVRFRRRSPRHHRQHELRGSLSVVKDRLPRGK
jgi:hypothetical protein